MIIFNLVGIIMMIIGFTISFGIGAILGTDAEGPLMMILGPILIAMDVTDRLRSKGGHLYIPSRGGSLFFLPVWAFGVLWFVLGIYDTVQGGS